MEDSLFHGLGEKAGVKRLVQSFYDHMDCDERFQEIRTLHPKDLSSSRTKLYLFLCGWLGGPNLYVEKFGHPRLRARHLPFPIGEEERDQWLACMQLALEDCQLSKRLDRIQYEFLQQRFSQTANFMRNKDL